MEEEAGEQSEFLVGKPCVTGCALACSQPSLPTQSMNPNINARRTGFSEYRPAAHVRQVAAPRRRATT